MYLYTLIVMSLFTGPGAIAAPGSRSIGRVESHVENCPEAPQNAPEGSQRLPGRIAREVARKIHDSRGELGNVNQGIIFANGPGNATSVVNTAASDTPVTIFPTPSSPSPPDQTAPGSNLTTPIPQIPLLSSSSLLTVPSPISAASATTAIAPPVSLTPLPLAATTSLSNLNLTITITGPTLTISTVTLPTPTSTRTVFITAPPITISPTGVVNGSSVSPSLSILTIITVTAWPDAPPATPAPAAGGTAEPLIGETVTVVETTTYATTSNGVAGKETATWTSVVVIPASVTEIEGSSVIGATTPITAPLATVTGTASGTTFEIVFVTLPAPAPSVVTVYEGTTTVTV